jgi:GT2 family glycosyltransferase
MCEKVNMPSVSVIILNFNGKKYLKKCVLSVLETKYPNFEVVLVDNGSTDRSLSSIEKTFGSDERLRIIRNSKNMGFAGGNNVGFEYATGTYIVFLNNDTVVDSNWLIHFIDAMEKDTTLGLAQSLLLKIDGSEIQNAGCLFSDYLMFQHSVAGGKPSNTRFSPVFEVSFANGAAMIIRRELVNEIGLFDPHFLFYYDDILLSFKTWLAGKRVATISRSKVYHVGGGTAGDSVYFKSFHFIIARICLMVDVYPKFGQLLTASFLLMLSFLYGALSNIPTGNLAVVSSQVRAIWWVLRNLRYIWRNKLKHWASARITPEMLLDRFIRIKLPIWVYLLPFSVAKKTGGIVSKVN